MRNRKLFGIILKNLEILRNFKEIGFDYILNPHTGELHYVSMENFWGSHNLATADLEEFIGLVNVGVIPIHKLPDGVPIPVYDLVTGELLGEYTLNKCAHCRFPEL